MDLKSSHMALSIGIDFCAGAHVQLSELTGVLRGSLLKKESNEYMCTINRKSTVWRETLEGANFGGFGGKSSNRQFLNHQCFSYILSAFKY